MNNCSIAIQVLPAVEEGKIIEVVDEVISHIKLSGLNYKVGAFETTVEGDFDELMDMVKECQKICIRAGAPSVMSYIKIAYSPMKGVWSIEEKVAKHDKTS